MSDSQKDDQDAALNAAELLTRIRNLESTQPCTALLIVLSTSKQRKELLQRRAGSLFSDIHNLSKQNEPVSEPLPEIAQQ